MADYSATFTAAEQTRLRQIFPHGVGDWSKRGVEQRDLLSTWITYTDVGKYTKDKRGKDNDEDNDDRNSATQSIRQRRGKSTREKNQRFRATSQYPASTSQTRGRRENVAANARHPMRSST